MPWFRLDDETGEHPKVLRAGNDGFGLWTRCGTHCARYLTDGFVDEAVALSKGPKKLIDKVTASGLWVKVDGGYLIEDYLDYNPSKEQVLAERKAAAERQKRAREKASERRANRSPSHGNSHGVTHTSVTVPPYPNPIDAAAAASERASGGSGDDLPVDVEILRSKMSAFTALAALRWDIGAERIAQVQALIDLHGDQRLVDAAVRTCRTPPPVSASAFVGTWTAMPPRGLTMHVVDEPRCPNCSLSLSACAKADAGRLAGDRCSDVENSTSTSQLSAASANFST